MDRVRVGSKYVYRPVGVDRFDPPYGVRNGTLADGAIVRVVNLPGCPRKGTMGHCHVELLDGTFAGLVCVNSLAKE